MHPVFDESEEVIGETLYQSLIEDFVNKGHVFSSVAAENAVVMGDS